MVESFQSDYFSAFPCIAEGHKTTASNLQTYGQLSTLGGRLRCFFGRLDGVQWLLFVIAHTERHRVDLMNLRRRFEARPSF